MARTLIAHVRAQWMGALALFLVIAGGTAYAANTIGSADVIDESLLSRDLRNSQVKTADVGNNEVRSVDVRDDTLTGGGLSAADLHVNSVAATEVESNAIDSDEIVDGQLNDEDVGEAQFVNFTGSIGVIQGNDCEYKKVTGLPLHNKDHLVLTPEVTTSKTELTYTPKWDASEPSDMWIQVCNQSSAAIDDGTAQFNLLVIDAG